MAALVGASVSEFLLWRADAAIVAGHTQEGMERLRLGEEWGGSMEIAGRRSRFLVALLDVAPAKFKWSMRRSILRTAAAQVARHPHRSEAWSMLANAQSVSGQPQQFKKSLERCLAFDPYGMQVETKSVRGLDRR